MAEVKWIKICTDVFDDEKIQLIDALPECDGVLVIWFKLLCLAGKQNNGGVFLLNDKIAYTDEMLATIFRRPLNTVRLALSTFEKFGMIEIVNDTITIPNWNKHQSLDTYEKKLIRDREYQAERRAKQKKLLNQKSSDNRLTIDDKSSLVAVSDKNKNKNKNLDLDDKDIKEEYSTPQAEAEQNCPYAKIKELYHKTCISYPKIKQIDGDRKKAVAARWRTYKSLDKFEEMFTLAEASSFLKGENERNWNADFDWMMKATNFSKILENKYADKGAMDGNRASGVFGTLQRMYEEAED